MLDKLKRVKNAALARPKKGSIATGQYIVGLDIGTEFVKALVAQVQDDRLIIIGMGREHQGLTDMQAGAIADIAAVVKNCDSALNQAEQQAGVSVRTAIIGIAGELVKGTTTTVKVRRKNPNKQLDMAETEQIISLVQERAQAKAKQQLAWELGGKDVEIRLVNSALVRIDIDGYPVTNPIGFQGKEVVIQLYTAFAPLIHIGALERTAQELDLDLVAVAAEPFAVARSVIGNDPNASMDAVLMDVGGGTTDIAVLHDGGVQGTQMFGIGGRAFTRSVEREMDIPFKQAETYKLALSDGHLPASRATAVRHALEKTLDVWVNGIELALGEFPMLDHLPNQVLLCGGGSSLDMLMERLEQSTWYKELPFTRRPQVQHIHPEDVVDITDRTGSVNDHTFITAMGLLRVGLDTLQMNDSSNGGSIRQRLDRMLQI
ncbi:MAG TPA: cell division FtsA domain-containing protein [Patescibacteria group bacterium]|nr:cell division FtsA domain-containing protein [Patescibacteria group bacterium]